MARVFDGTVNVSFHQCFLVTDSGLGSEGSDPTDYYLGQTNGLCGASISGLLYFMTGLHSGLVGFTVDVLEINPPLDESWEEIVEVSFVQKDAEASLMHSTVLKLARSRLPQGFTAQGSV